jgi:general secretion pathway protein I
MRTRSTAGFTLIEIMIALAVFAVVSAALVRNAAVAVRQTGILEDRTLGIWVAEPDAYSG